MLQGDFNHMANIITVLFEQIIVKNMEKEASWDRQESRLGKSTILIHIFVNHAFFSWKISKK